MSQIRTTLPILPAANDATTFYVAMQPITSGKTYANYVSPNLTFNPSTKQFLLNGAPVNQSKITTSLTAPKNPTVGDRWYDNGSNIIFRYQFDGEQSYWIDTTSTFSIII